LESRRTSGRRAFEEYVAVIRALWTEREVNVSGEFVSLNKATLVEHDRGGSRAA
jgi:alkanesulfonate monooxygenase SsuD/methylene tetrahydromethanopterin reductase-like flavin-dependent oxidoreductase (luciferase family)